jgi:hypothetical protein
MPQLEIPGAYYAGSIQEFIATSPDAVLGALVRQSDFDVEPPQRDAWLRQIEILRQSLLGLEGTLFLEYVVPRIGSRLDAVFVTGSLIFPIEFKVGESQFRREAIDQVWDYALDLKNFHEGSHGAGIVPILVATDAPTSPALLGEPHSDGVRPPSCCNSDGLRRLIDLGLADASGSAIDSIRWGRSPYRPTPTILEAARALYSQHSVEAIARNDAGARNLGVTSQCVEDLIDEAQRAGRKIIIFVTGVPGAGKTLVGLNVATRKRDELKPTHAVFLSGNGPLVMVLREALTRDEFARLRSQGKKARKGEVGQRVKAFIQNVHHFRDAALREDDAPSDHVVIFDEAQRAWNREMTADFMRRKRKRPGFGHSEPEFLVSYMDRHRDWAVVICLVGGGQEINRGEAGIGAWLEAVRESFPLWRVYVSPNLTDSEYAAGKALKQLEDRANTVKDERLHLAVSMRSFRCENVSRFVKAVLDLEHDEAAENLEALSQRFPIVVTRDLFCAKQWIRQRARGTERYGLLASSGAMRLKPYAVDVRVEVNPIHWFLDGPEDTRSSYYMEDAATEFQVQGLELDRACVNWDADLRYGHGGWGYYSFRGNSWTTVRSNDRRQFLLNAYRVLLTRARQGMAIFVPPGDADDPTRRPEFYDGTFRYLVEIGLPTV